MTPSADPGPPEPHDLDHHDNVALLSRSLRRVQGYVDTLIDRPFDRDTYRQFADYLEVDGWRAATAYEALCRQSPQDLQRQLDPLYPCTPTRTPRRSSWSRR